MQKEQQEQQEKQEQQEEQRFEMMQDQFYNVESLKSIHSKLDKRLNFQKEYDSTLKSYNAHKQKKQKEEKIVNDLNKDDKNVLTIDDIEVNDLSTDDKFKACTTKKENDMDALVDTDKTIIGINENDVEELE